MIKLTAFCQVCKVFRTPGPGGRKQFDKPTKLERRVALVCVRVCVCAWGEGARRDMGAPFCDSRKAKESSLDMRSSTVQWCPPCIIDELEISDPYDTLTLLNTNNRQAVNKLEQNIFD